MSTTTKLQRVGEVRLSCDHCGAAVFRDGTSGGGYALEDGTWVASWASCGDCCRRGAAARLQRTSQAAR